jgi:hypothetical protein
MKGQSLILVALLCNASGWALGQSGPPPIGMACFDYADQHCCDYASGLMITCGSGPTWTCAGQVQPDSNPRIKIAVVGDRFFTGGQYLVPDKSCKCKYFPPICGQGPGECSVSTTLITATTYWSQPTFNDPCP